MTTRAVSWCSGWIQAWTATWAFALRLFANQRGGSAIEFAFAAPVLFMILLGTVEAAHLYLVQSELTSAARQAARRLAVDAMTVDQTEAYVRSRLAEVTGAVITVTVLTTDLQQNRTDLTVRVAVPMRDVMLFGFESLIPETAASEAPAVTTAAAVTSSADDDDDGSSYTQTTETTATPIPSASGPMLSASASMIKE
ncbi:MAG: TadE/TadG family type IV pilus assembly protein [Defluviicoccus sp.]